LKTVLITGGTGFFGKSILAYIGENNLGIEEVYILSRNPKKLSNDFNLKNFPFKITLIPHDIEKPIVFDKYVDFVIHAATSVGLQDPLETKKIIIDGTENVLKYCVRKNIKRLLYVSSGAVYGSQPIGIKKINENYISDYQSRTVYGNSKYEAEKLCELYYNNYNLDFVIARGFAFVGPYLPIDIHFAIGNFIRDGLNGKDIIIKGDGRTIRSYLFSDDLASWLFSILLKGETGESYNVGSDEAISLSDLAYKVKNCFKKNIDVKILGSLTDPVNIYVPDVSKIKNNLDVVESVSIDEAIIKTIKFHS